MKDGGRADFDDEDEDEAPKSATNADVAGESDDDEEMAEAPPPSEHQPYNGSGASSPTRTRTRTWFYVAKDDNANRTRPEDTPARRGTRGFSGDALLLSATLLPCTWPLAALGFVPD